MSLPKKNQKLFNIFLQKLFTFLCECEMIERGDGAILLWTHPLREGLTGSNPVK